MQREIALLLPAKKKKKRKTPQVTGNLELEQPLQIEQKMFSSSLIPVAQVTESGRSQWTTHWHINYPIPQACSCVAFTAAMSQSREGSQERQSEGRKQKQKGTNV